MFEKEFRELDLIGEKALAALRSGKNHQARIELNKLRRSHFVTEAIQVEVRVLVTRFAELQDGDSARKVIQNNMAYLWGDPDLLSASNFINKPISERTKFFRIQFTGATVILGMFSVFDERSVCTFEALATSAREAIRYFSELMSVDDLRKLNVIQIETGKIDTSAIHFEGVIDTYPFRASSRIERRLKSLVKVADILPEGAIAGQPVRSAAFARMEQDFTSGDTVKALRERVFKGAIASCCPPESLQQSAES